MWLGFCGAIWCKILIIVGPILLALLLLCICALLIFLIVKQIEARRKKSSKIHPTETLEQGSTSAEPASARNPSGLQSVVPPGHQHNNVSATAGTEHVALPLKQTQRLGQTPGVVPPGHQPNDLGPPPYNRNYALPTTFHLNGATPPGHQVSIVPTGATSTATAPKEVAVVGPNSATGF